MVRLCTSSIVLDTTVLDAIVLDTSVLLVPVYYWQPAALLDIGTFLLSSFFLACWSPGVSESWSMHHAHPSLEGQPSGMVGGNVHARAVVCLAALCKMGTLP